MLKGLRYIGKFMVFVREYMLDMWFFIKHNNHSPLEDDNRRKYFKLLILSHAIEKGLSLGNPRPLFGREKVAEIIRASARYDISFSKFPIAMAKGALSAYYNENSKHATANHPTLVAIQDFLKSGEVAYIRSTGGVKQVSRFPTEQACENANFLLSRTSCRMFDRAPLSREMVEKVLRVAQSAPSQCNRQSIRIHFYQEPSIISELLSLQGGASGFAESVGNLFLISSEITAWGGPQQRNQLYVDGGLYSMMLMLACHAHGIAACPLNLAVTNSVEEKIKKLGAIEKNQRLIMMIAVGYSAEPIVKAARSPRCNVEDVAHFH